MVAPFSEEYAARDEPYVFLLDDLTEPGPFTMLAQWVMCLERVLDARHRPGLGGTGRLVRADDVGTSAVRVGLVVGLDIRILRFEEAWDGLDG